MRRAEDLLDCIAGLSTELDAHREFRAQITAEIKPLVELVSGEPEYDGAKPFAAVVIAVLERLRKELADAKVELVDERARLRSERDEATAALAFAEGQPKRGPNAS